MSTDYYKFQEPINAVLVTEIKDSHVNQISIWMNHKFSGSLFMDLNETAEFLAMIRESDPIAHRHLSKAIGGLQMTIHKNLDPATCIISGSDKILRFRDLETKELEKR